MIKCHLIIIIPSIVLLIGCATGSEIDTGGYFSTGMTLSSAEIAPIEEPFTLTDERNEQKTVKTEMSIESIAITKHDGIMDPHR